MKTPIKQGGFTLVEIMIVVAIIGLLSAMCMPSLAKARKTSQAVATAKDLRTFYDAFQQYAMASGGFSSAPGVPGVIPAYLTDYTVCKSWAKTPAGGRYYYKSTCFGALDSRPAVGIVSADGKALNAELMQIIDERIDNGDLTSGSFVRLSLTAYYLLLDK